MDKTYKDRGYSDTFEKAPTERKIPFMTKFDVQSYLEGIPAGLLQGGVIKSVDGKLTIDLDNGTIYYDDGVDITTLI